MNRCRDSFIYLMDKTSIVNHIYILIPCTPEKQARTNVAIQFRTLRLMRALYDHSSQNPKALKSVEIPPLASSLKLDDPAPVIERAAGLHLLRAHFPHHERLHLAGPQRFEHGLGVGVVPHVVPAVVPRGFVAVVVQHHGDDAVAVLRVEGDVVPACVGGESAGALVVVEGRRGKSGEVGGQGA